MATKKAGTNKSTAVSVIIPGVFENINFSALNKTIEALANNNAALTPEEKTFAVDAIKDWENNVLRKLTDKACEGGDIIRSLEVNDSSFIMTLDDDMLENMVNATGTRKLYEDFLVKYETYKAIEKPEPPVVDLSDSLEAQLVLKQDYALQMEKYRIKRSKAEDDAKRALKKFKIALNEQDSVKELINRIKKFNRNLNKFRMECSEKSQLAKISVTIESKEIRDALKNLLGFSI